MSETPFVVELAGRRWALPHLSFRLIKTIQPALFELYSETARSVDRPLSEAQIDSLAAVVWRAIGSVDPALELDAFLDMPFSVADLFRNLPVVAEAAGLRVQTATAEASPEMGKSTSTA